MNLLKNINAALVTAYKAAVAPELPTAYEAKDFTVPSKAAWARVVNFPADKYVNSLGDGGDDLTVGFFQIDYFVPENTGTSALHSYADATLTYFKNGRRLTYGGQEVKIRRTSLSPIRRDDASASFRITLTIYWDAPSSR